MDGQDSGIKDDDNMKIGSKRRRVSSGFRNEQEKFVMSGSIDKESTANSDSVNNNANISKGQNKEISVTLHLVGELIERKLN